MRLKFGLLVALGLLAGWPAGASPAERPSARAAATCADYANQAEAQRAADTRDADGDGVYCEGLPCPCLGAGSAGGGGDQGAGEKPKGSGNAGLGRSITFGPVRRSSGCNSHDGLADRACTPGAYYAKATKPRVCTAGYSSRVRHVTESTKDAIYRAYGVRQHSRATYEVDHLVPLELGGSNTKANLFAEAAEPTPGFHEKDRLENKLRDVVCSGGLGLRHAQRLFARNWLRAYHRYVE